MELLTLGFGPQHFLYKTISSTHKSYSQYLSYTEYDRVIQVTKGKKNWGNFNSWPWVHFFFEAVIEKEEQFWRDFCLKELAFLLRLAAYHKQGSPGLILGLMLFNIFIDDLDDGTEITLTKFADVTKLGGEVNKSEGTSIFQRELYRLEECASKNYMKFNKV